MNEICSLNLTALADALQKKEIGAEEATRACLDRIAATEERVGALLHVDAEGALARARQLDAQGPDASQPLWGVPVTVKDALSTQGMPPLPVPASSKATCPCTTPLPCSACVRPVP